MDRADKAGQPRPGSDAPWLPWNPYSWQRWTAELSFPEKGYYEVWARATDDAGVSQPFAINWNPKGYLNNSLHRISV